MIYERLSIEERKQRQAESRLKFAEIYEKTLDVFELDPEQTHCRGGFQQCWYDILKVWSNLGTSRKYDLLYMAVYHIVWDRHYGTNLSPEYLELLSLVERALLDEGYAYEVWSSCGALNLIMKEFRAAFLLGTGQTVCKSAWFGKYIYACAYSKLRIKGRPTTRLPFGMLRGDVLMLRSTDNVKNIIAAFEKVIIQLLPNAAAWTRAAWADEAAIMKELYQAHGIDYTQKPGAFDELVDAVSMVLQGRNYERSLLLLDELPASMVRCLWPEDTEKNLERFFIRVCKRVRKQMKENPKTYGAFRKDVLEKSWVYRQYEDGTWTPSHNVTVQKFNVQLGI